MLLNPFTFHSPKSITGAIELSSTLDHAKLQAGGTFLLNNLKLLKKKEVKTPEHVISLRRVPNLKGISEEGKSIIIRSMTTMSELMDSSLLQGNLSFLKDAAANIGTTSIRNMATIGGNLTCRYTWTEMPAIMIGLEANLHFAGPDNNSDTMPAEEFFNADAKTHNILTHVTIQKDSKAVIVYRRVKKSPHLDIPLLSLLIKTNRHGKTLKNARVAVNNGIAFGQRDYKLEEFLNQSDCSKGLAQEALNHLDERIYDTRSSDYKKHMFRVAIKDAITEIVGAK